MDRSVKLEAMQLSPKIFSDLHSAHEIECLKIRRKGMLGLICLLTTIATCTRYPVVSKK